MRETILSFFITQAGNAQILLLKNPKKHRKFCINFFLLKKIKDKISKINTAFCFLIFSINILNVNKKNLKMLPKIFFDEPLLLFMLLLLMLVFRISSSYSFKFIFFMFLFNM